MDMDIDNELGLVCLSMLIHDVNGIPTDTIMLELTTFKDSLDYTAHLIGWEKEEVLEVVKDLIEGIYENQTKTY
jgi:hypothetical protein